MIIGWIFSISSILFLTWEMLEYRNDKMVAGVTENSNDLSACLVTTLIAMTAAPFALLLKSVAWMERRC